MTKVNTGFRPTFLTARPQRLEGETATRTNFLPTTGPKSTGPGFELAFGFIPTVNVGNILGIDNDAARILLNIVADPIAIASSFLSGGLTAAGKVASATKALQTTKGVLRGMPGLTGFARVRKTQGILKTLAKLESNPQIAKQMRAAIDIEDAMSFTKALRQLNKSPIAKEIRDQLPSTPELFKLDDLLQAENVFNKGQAGTGLTKELVPGFVNQVEQGQRALIQGRIPFTNIRKSLVDGKFVYGMLDSLFPASPLLSKRVREMSAGGAGILGTGGAILATTGRELFKGMLGNKNIFMHANVIPESKRVIAGLVAKTEKLAPGSTKEGLPSLLTFFREGKGIDLATVERLGLTDEFARLGVRTNTGKLATGEAFEFFSKGSLEKFLNRKGDWRKAADALNQDLQRHFDELYDFMNKSGLGLDINHLEGYINRIYDIDTKTAGKLAKEWKRTGTFLSKRKFDTQLKALTQGYKFKTNDAFELLSEYQLVTSRVVQNRQIMETFKDTRNRLRLNNVEVPFLTTQKTLTRLNKADPKLDLFDEYVRVTDEGVRSFLGMGKDSPTTRQWMHKSVARDLGAIFGKPFDGPVAKMADAFNANSKFLQLAGSLFHSFALTESAMAVMGPVKGLQTAIALGGGVPFLPKFMRDGMLKVGLGKNPAAFADDAMNQARAAGLTFGENFDIQMNVVQQTMAKIEGAITSKIPGAQKVLDIAGPGRITKEFNDALWTNFHTPMKLVAFQDRMKLARKLNPNLDEGQLAADVAKFVNNAFGGQNWEQLLVHPKFKQAMHWALLAPDWTISNLKIAGVGTTGVTGAVRGALGKGRNPAEQLTGRYWRNAVPIFFGMSALANRALSGHWIWENAPGHTLDIELADKDDKGRLQYIKFGKQFREPFRWLTEPTKIFGAKLSPGIQTAVEQFTAHSTTGFPTEFASEKNKIPLTFMEEVPLRAKAFIEKLVPFSFRGNSFMLALPKSTFSERDAIRGVADSMKGGKVRTTPDRKAIREILKLAQANGLDVSRIKSAVRREVGDPNKVLDQNLDVGQPVGSFQ